MNSRFQTSSGHLPGPGRPEREEGEAGGVDPIEIIDWRSNLVMIVQVEKRVASESNLAPDTGHHMMLVPPSLDAFDKLREDGVAISGMWLCAVGMTGPGSLVVDQIEQVASWTARTGTGQPLLVLHGKEGRLYGIEDDEVITLGPTYVHWLGSGTFRQPMD